MVLCGPNFSLMFLIYLFLYAAVYRSDKLLPLYFDWYLNYSVTRDVINMNCFSSDFSHCIVVVVAKTPLNPINKKPIFLKIRSLYRLPSLADILRALSHVPAPRFLVRAV